MLRCEGSRLVLPCLSRTLGGGVQQAGRGIALEPKSNGGLTSYTGPWKDGHEEVQMEGRKLGPTSRRDGEGQVSSGR